MGAFETAVEDFLTASHRSYTRVFRPDPEVISVSG